MHYISAPEAMCCLFGFPISDRSHTVIRLGVHLPDGQRVVFNDDDLDEFIIFLRDVNKYKVYTFKIQISPFSTKTINFSCNYNIVHVP